MQYGNLQARFLCQIPFRRHPKNHQNKRTEYDFVKSKGHLTTTVDGTREKRNERSNQVAKYSMKNTVCQEAELRRLLREPETTTNSNQEDTRLRQPR
ncbi:unnamed protein product [Caenorhabditis nigoni]